MWDSVAFSCDFRPDEVMIPKKKVAHNEEYDVPLIVYGEEKLNL